MNDSVPDTPEQATMPAPGSPEDEFDTIATLPAPPQSLMPSQRFTQPTQLLDPPYKNPVVQVAASSSPPPAPSPPRRPAGGFLSSLIAPSGTHFRPPPAPARRTPVFDLEDGPTYRGGSSDEENPTSQSPDIKPAMFEKTRSPEKVAESPVRANGTMDRFKEITSSALYDPNAPNKGAKRPADQMSPVDGAKGVAVKKVRQDMPARAQPADSAMLALDDYRMRVKVERILKVLPTKSVEECVVALSSSGGNYDAALDQLTGDDGRTKSNGNPAITIDSSEDELAVSSTPFPAPMRMAKQNIKSTGTIHDKWAKKLSTQRDQAPAAAPKPRGRLMRGPRSRASPPISIASDRSNTPKKNAGRLQQGRRRAPSASSVEEEMTDSDDSDAQQGTATNSLEPKVLKFFNNCSLSDLADIAAIPAEDAKIITDQRPFASLDEVRVLQAPVDENEKPPAKKARKPAKPMGEKIVDKCLEMWEGYLAVDALVAECEMLGQPVAEKMKKWGVDIFGKADGELELTNFNGMNGANVHDSGIATPNSNRPSPQGLNDQNDDDDDDEDDLPVAHTRKPNLSTESEFIQQPSIMAEDLEMKDYQIVGINWLALLYEMNLSCILADDMGLGKTCQVIAFIAYLMETGVTGPHLVVVPSSTMENWLREFEKFCPRLNVIPYHADAKTRAELREYVEDNRDDINVVVTTYNIAKGKLDTKFLRDQDFCACVFDEGHILKNSSSQVYEKLLRIPAKFRLLLTGTPLQNNLQELASLLGFILPQVFNEHKTELHQIFSNKANTDKKTHETLLSAQRIDRAKNMLRPFVLRRKKHQVIDLPAKIQRVQYCDMKPSQLEIYEREQQQVRQLLADRAAGKKTGSKSANILMKLRQAAIHPLLARRHYTDSTLRKMSQACLKDAQWALSDPNVIYEELLAYSDFECHKLCTDNPKALGKFKLVHEEWMDSGKIDQLRDLLVKFIANGDRTLIFSQFVMVMNILECMLETLHIEFVRIDGTTKVEDRQAIMDTFHERTEIPVFLLSTKAGGAGINLACANKVIIFDSSFNPQEDVQAENRAHRVGQTRDVEVFRFVTRDTIEMQMYNLGQTKLALDQAVVGDDENDSKGEEVGMKAVESMMLADLDKETKEVKEATTDGATD
ncbi:ATP-dependent helicase fft2 [Penicillium capsulatum]|uniref:DNA helicase n=1 Tax=Penicillium capsulatum TaxID=69766 RepID=A0A9W9LW69_9EURO|nr:ATP-dependent helicase fft2 [Penicillium capsulatum]KAJ6122780.1 ATP-dependent helicase fft2 [Penicillium capsulatum]